MNKSITIADLITAHGADRILSAVILDVGGDKHTGSNSYWIPASELDISNQEDVNVRIVRELPDQIMICSDGSVWKIA